MTPTRRRAPAAPPVSFEPTDPGSPDARWCIEQYYAELSTRFEGGFDAHLSTVTDVADFAPPGGLFIVGRLEGRPVACGALKLVTPEVAYLKRMWVDGSVRGAGLGRRLLGALEEAAAGLGCAVVQLETNRVLAEAIRLYRTSGYEEVEPFNDEFYAHHWFRKSL
ncbi:MAG: hypothetical protein AMXMBFR53_00690 [Gemmatimonadota bacterium]